LLQRFCTYNSIFTLFLIVWSLNELCNKTFWTHMMWGISLPPEQLVTSQEGLYSMELT